MQMIINIPKEVKENITDALDMFGDDYQGILAEAIAFGFVLPEGQEITEIEFKEEIKGLISTKLDQINHYVSGVNSPFTYQQIRNVQEYLCDIRSEIGIQEKEE